LWTFVDIYLRFSLAWAAPPKAAAQRPRGHDNHLQRSRL